MIRARKFHVLTSRSDHRYDISADVESWRPLATTKAGHPGLYPASESRREAG